MIVENSETDIYFLNNPYAASYNFNPYSIVNDGKIELYYTSYREGACKLINTVNKAKKNGI